MVNYVAAVTNHFCLALVAAFTQPEARLLAQRCKCGRHIRIVPKEASSCAKEREREERRGKERCWRLLRCIRERQRRRGAIYLLLNGANYKSRPFERRFINHLGQDQTERKVIQSPAKGGPKVA